MESQLKPCKLIEASVFEPQILIVLLNVLGERPARRGERFQGACEKHLKKLQGQGCDQNRTRKSELLVKFASEEHVTKFEIAIDGPFGRPPHEAGA